MLKTIKIGELGTIITGNTPPRNKPELYGHHTPFIKATDISENRKYTYAPEECYSESGYQKYIKSLIPKGSTCVVTIGTIGKKMTMAHRDCFINQAMNAILPNERYDSEYVYYVVKNNLHKLKNMDSGTTSGRENVSKSAFMNIEIQVIDDYSTQKRIGQILAVYDSLIENNQKQIKRLEEAAQRLYQEWFVKLRFPGHEKVKVVDGVPEGWKRVSLGNICTTPKTVLKPESIPQNIPYIGLEHMPRRDICLCEWGTSSDVTSSKAVYHEKDILFGKIRPYFHKVGYALNEGIASTDIIIMQGNEGYWGLLLMLVSSDQFVEYTYQTCKEGAKMPRADWRQMKDYPVVVADNETQMKFEAYIETVTQRIKRLALQNRCLAEARDRLLPKLMSGEIEV